MKDGTPDFSRFFDTTKSHQFGKNKKARLSTLLFLNVDET